MGQGSCSPVPGHKGPSKTPSRSQKREQGAASRLRALEARRAPTAVGVFPSCSRSAQPQSRKARGAATTPCWGCSPRRIRCSSTCCRLQHIPTRGQGRAVPQPRTAPRQPPLRAQRRSGGRPLCPELPPFGEQQPSWDAAQAPCRSAGWWLSPHPSTQRRGSPSLPPTLAPEVSLTQAERSQALLLPRAHSCPREPQSAAPTEGSRAEGEAWQTGLLQSLYFGESQSL